uniref:hypothetical protein n=1 Tax=Spizellomyces sp. 'palustris' TaxID=117820 RepID=UPI0010FBD19D|nr:hypothetical protein [Spizellomyces sp. 'palustris']QCQ69028.1 hypothetical protein [Spizellomyces sp. 'palustris']
MFMPIGVHAVSIPSYLNFIESQRDGLDSDLLATLPLIAIRSLYTSTGNTGSTDYTPDDTPDEEDKAEEESTKATYIVSNLNQASVSKVYNTQRDLLADSEEIFGFILGRKRLLSIINNGGILHTSKGTFIISITGINI